jgi:hypothetical protein
MDRAAIRKLDSSGKVAIATVADSVIPALSVSEERADWGFLLVRSHPQARYSLISPLQLFHLRYHSQNTQR